MPVFRFFFALGLCISEKTRYERQDLLNSNCFSYNPKSVIRTRLVPFPYLHYAIIHLCIFFCLFSSTFLVV